ncbi:hypothetical protein Pcinc_043980 [Petrolisthes cinctipes]|uniref:Uncharacterized protein n=1 Tax=Petrolisthes cinctipes TaxID=88211 RepID=A0AAE1BEY0_PETCI|nr:hypothetical protein Pcinc_043980 [Petrolisthes cinctipes]
MVSTALPKLILPRYRKNGTLPLSFNPMDGVEGGGSGGGGSGTSDPLATVSSDGGGGGGSGGVVVEEGGGIPSCRLYRLRHHTPSRNHRIGGDQKCE